jgi:ribose-phosphate pyrophosphokinase
MNRPLVFSLPEYRYLQDAFCSQSSFEAGSIENKLFPDGERYLRLQSDVTGRHVILIGGTISDSATLMLYDLATALVKFGAERLIVVIPYFGYATMERASKSGEVVIAKTRARLLSSLPDANFGNHLVFLDLHSDGIPHYLEGNITAAHVYGRRLIIAAAKKLYGDEFVLASTDAGRAKWVQSMANEMRVDAAFVYKRRLDGATTEVTAVSANVAGKNVVLYDDMIRTGSSLMNAGRAYLDAGAKELVAIATHAVLPGDAWMKIKNSGLFKQILCTDSHPRALELAPQGLEILPVASLLLPHCQ